MPDPRAEKAGCALDGVKVVDLTRVLGGPYCTMILADHGADVIKVEPPGGDETRTWGPPFRDCDGDRAASYFIGVNRNKRSLMLDLSSEEGRNVVLALLEDADVLVENFKPGTMERWGLGYAKHLETQFPRLIHCRVSGFGADGPFGGLAGYDAAVQALTGLMSINGDPASGPTRLGNPIVDLSTGLYSAVAILMALHERHRSGRGQFIDMTLYDCGLAMLHPQAANYLLGGRRPVSLGNAHPNLAPCDKFQTKTGEIFLAVGNDNQFRKLAQAVGCPALADDRRFRSNSDRVENKKVLAALLQEALEPVDGKAMAEQLLRLGVPAGAVLFIDEALAMPHTNHRKMVADTNDYCGIATPIKFSRSVAVATRRPPKLGEHNCEVIGELGNRFDELGKST
ncbi:MAG: CoA transferase [Xanthobacteraceae bacterium]|nr:CoA transferase [Xanthobacteraceae bacterium]